MLIIGVDDTDSEKGLCTTYLAAVLMERLSKIGDLAGLPRLVRLNPCARFKTRGNAAVAMTVNADPARVRDIALDTLLELSDLSGKNTNPGLVIAEEVTPEMEAFYMRAVTEILTIREAKELIGREGIWARGFKKERGLIGALAAVGAVLDGNDSDHTYELIAYRERSRWGTPRWIDPSSVWRADLLTYPGTWDTVDCENEKVVFAPHSPDPILFGIRGDDPLALEEAFSRIASEPWERRALYVTNQGTDAQILEDDISGVVDDRSYRLRGMVACAPRSIEGGHLFFTLRDEGGETLECAAFEPTKNFREVVKRLAEGDLLEVYGAVRSGTLNLEKVDVLCLAEQKETRAPRCPSCNRRMKSAGRGQGYRCRRCKTRSADPEIRPVRRDLEPGLYEVPPTARRHLSKPLIRHKNPGAHPSR